MADIMMCQNENCGLADNCYRFTAPPNLKYQSYLITDKEVESEEDCIYFWRVD